MHFVLGLPFISFLMRLHPKFHAALFYFAVVAFQIFDTVAWIWAGAQTGVTVSTDKRIWQPGSYKLGDKTVAFPAGVLYTADMKMLDAVHYDTVDDLVAMVKKNQK